MNAKRHFKYTHRQRDKEWKKKTKAKTEKKRKSILEIQWIYNYHKRIFSGPYGLFMSAMFLVVWFHPIPTKKKSTEKLVGFALLTNSKKHQCRARVHVHCTYTIRYAMLHTNFILFRNELNSLDFQNENNYGRRFTFWPSHRINWIEWIAFTLEWVQMESMRSFLFVYWCLYIFISVFLMLALCPSFFLDLVCAPFTFNFSLIII